MTTSPKTHEMSMNLVKDSLEKQLDSPTDNREPKSDKSGGLKIVEYF
jgi:hypothetical protein